MPSYIAIIHKDPESSFGVSFPDFPGCITAGDTLDEAFRQAHEVLPFHIRGMIEDGEAIPSPSTLEQVTADPDNAGGVPTIVNVQIPGKAVRVNVTFDEGLLAAIDAFAKAHGLTRSGFLAEVARNKIGAGS